MTDELAKILTCCGPKFCRCHDARVEAVARIAAPLTSDERQRLWDSINFYDDEADDLPGEVENIIAARIARAGTP